MQKDYRPCLEKLAGAPPKRKAALIRSLLPGIEAALHSGQSLKDIWEALGNEGLQEAKVKTVEGRDPFANLRRLEEDRPGFHWRGTRSLKTLVCGTEDTNDKNER